MDLLQVLRASGCCPAAACGMGCAGRLSPELHLPHGGRGLATLAGSWHCQGDCTECAAQSWMAALQGELRSFMTSESSIL